MAHESWSFLLIIIILIMLLGERNYGKYPETNFDFIIHCTSQLHESLFKMPRFPFIGPLFDQGWRRYPSAHFFLVSRLYGVGN